MRFFLTNFKCYNTYIFEVLFSFIYIRGHSVGRGEGGTSAARRPPRRATLREFVPHELEKRKGKEWVLDIACEGCGIAQHPTGTVKGCPIRGCHVCCQGRFGRGCNMEDGKAFFRALYEELVKPDNLFQVDPLNDWVDQLESGASS